MSLKGKLINGEEISIPFPCIKQSIFLSNTLMLEEENFGDDNPSTQNAIPPIDLRISPSDWSKYKHFCTEIAQTELSTKKQFVPNPHTSAELFHSYSKDDILNAIKTAEYLASDNYMASINYYIGNLHNADYEEISTACKNKRIDLTKETSKAIQKNKHAINAKLFEILPELAKYGEIEWK